MIKQKFSVIKNKIKVGVYEAYEWCRDNPEMAIAIGGGILAGSKFLVKSGIKRSNLNKQEDLKNLYCYDRSLGHYWKLRRELRNDEWIEIDRRKRSGETLSDILYSMHVLE